jgi:hypothetical protein
VFSISKLAAISSRADTWRPLSSVNCMWFSGVNKRKNQNGMNLF